MDGDRVLFATVRAAVALWLSIAIVLASPSTFGQGNFGTTPRGGRSALMGGTGIALARDGSAPFLNPATIVRIDDSGIAFNVNVFTFQLTHFTGFHQPGAVDPSRYGDLRLPDTSLDNTRFDGMPSTLCLFLSIGDAAARRKGKQRIAACFGYVERQEFDATADTYAGTSSGLSATQAQSLSRHWNRFYAGPSYSGYVSDRVSIGASLHGIATTLSSAWSVDTIVRDDSGRASVSSFDQSTTATSIDLSAVLGLMWHVDDVNTFGASVSTPSLHVLGRYQGAIGIQQQTGAESRAMLQTASGDFMAPPPVRVGVGFGAERPNLRTEGDLGLWVPMARIARADAHVNRTEVVNGAATTSSFDTSFDATARPVVDAAFGVEMFLDPRLSMIGGARTDFSALDPIASPPPLGTIAESRMHRVAVSGGMASYGDGSELLLGGELSYGWGQSVAVDPYTPQPSLALVDQRSFGVMIIVAGGVSLAAFKRTLTELRDVTNLPVPIP